MSFETDFSPVDYLLRRVKYYHKKIVRWENRKSNGYENYQGDIGRAIDDWNMRKEQYEKAIDKLLNQNIVIKQNKKW